MEKLVSGFLDGKMIKNNFLQKICDGREYLLSVRGLGLKSVECVRLLTLHHLAFPVSCKFMYLTSHITYINLIMKKFDTRTSAIRSTQMLEE